MKKLYELLIIAIAIINASCSSTKPEEFDDVWINKDSINGKSFHNLFIIVLTSDIDVKTKVENMLADKTKAKGYKTVKSSDVMPYNIKDPKIPTRDEIVNTVKASGCDGVLISSLFKKEEAVNYTPGTTAYSTSPEFAFVGNYVGYYTHYYPTVSTSSYYSHDKSYFVQTNLYDVSSEQIMWSVKSKIFNPSSLDDFINTYLSDLIRQLEKAKLLKK
jgi:hypothetical protein